MPLDREKAREVLAQHGLDVDIRASVLASLAVCVTPDRVQHNHVTRDVKSRGKCSACDETWRSMAEANVAAVLALHFATASSSGPYAANCAACSHNWPCATARACGVIE